MNLNILSYFVSMKVLKVEIRRVFLEKAMLLSPTPLPYVRFLGVSGVWPLFQTLGKNTQMNYLEIEICNPELKRHNWLPTMNASDIKSITEHDRDDLPG